jgi:hypothetical protein
MDSKDTNAIPIETNELMKTFRKVAPASVKDSDKRDIAYYEMAETRGWVQFKEDVDSLISSLDSSVKLENAKDISEFGFMVLARDLAKTYLNYMVNLVDGSYETLNQKENG